MVEPDERAAVTEEVNDTKEAEETTETGGTIICRDSASNRQHKQVWLRGYERVRGSISKREAGVI